LRTQAGIAAAAAQAGAARSDAERIVGDLWRSGIGCGARAPLDFAPLRRELARIDALADARAIAAYVAERHARGWPVLFEFAVEPDFDDPRRTIGCVTQGGLGLPDRDLYLDADARAQSLRDAYAAHVATMLEAGGLAPDAATAQAAAVVALETRLAAASLPRRALARDVTLRRRRVAIAAADRECPCAPWSAFFAAHGVAPPATFSLAMPAFHAEVQRLLADAPAAAWRAYLRFHTVDDLAAWLGDDLAAAAQRFRGGVLRGRRRLPPRWKRVLDAMNACAGDALGELYLAQAWTRAGAEAAEALVARLRAAFRARIERLDWMSAATRARALAKLAAMRVKIGGPAPRRDRSPLATSPTDWLENLLAARAFARRRLVAKLAAPTDADEWPMTPQTVNAGYDPLRNEIACPAAILQPPFFDADADAALNYGGIGAVLAHEMTHGYDDQGSRFGADGRFDDGWSADDRARFDARARRLVEHFDAANVHGQPVDGRLTLGENIADFGGLAIAFDALRAALAERGGADPMLDGYDQHQRFFLSWATIWRQTLAPAEARTRLRVDPHAPAALRVNLAAADLPGFFDAFSVGAAARAAHERLGIW
ncbi:MAG TPA: M13-type metalloendopeptidase, partial [Dokdonella sp.]